jgi:hypothetical protein
MGISSVPLCILSWPIVLVLTWKSLLATCLVSTVSVRLCARSARESLHVSNQVIGRARDRVSDRVQVLFYSR